MGAWGVQSFDNDAACDWKSRVEEADDLAVVEEAIDAVIDADDSYLDSDIGCEALAACEVLARLQGNWGPRNAYTESLDRWVESHKLVPPGRLVERAVAAIDRILGEESELRELWEDSGSDQEWRQSVEELRARLQV